jgi:hypothetical protein
MAFSVRLLAVSFIVASTAMAAAETENKQYVCEPVDTTLEAYSIQCEVADGVVSESSCSCKENYVMVDLDTAPSTLPPKPASAQ